jgi:hypothetical protein
VTPTTSRQSYPYQYVPNWAMYSRAPEGWHDEPFEFVFQFQATGITSLVAATATNQPCQIDPDADFFMRGLAVLQDIVAHSKTALYIPMQMRLRNAFGRPLDNAFIPMSAYAASPNFTNGPVNGDLWQASPWYPELYIPANGALWMDFEPLTTLGVDQNYYSIHVYLQGVKRFKNEVCKPGEKASNAPRQAA